MKLNPIFTSHMVFAAGKPIRVWGEGPGKGEILFAGAVRRIDTEDDFWMAEFPPMEYGGGHEMRCVLDGREEVLSDIAIGEVYLMAGQSNMQFKLREGANAGMPADESLDIRLFAPAHSENKETILPSDGWVKNGDRIDGWTALGYLTADALARKKGITVGLVTCYQGASCIESWVPAGTFAALGIQIAPEDKHYDHRHPLFERWNGDAYLYNFAFSQVCPFAFSAVVWYQGESDTTPAEGRVYAAELAALIDIWRRDLKNETLPFIIVQIADFTPRLDEGWRLVQQAQLDIQTMRSGVKTVISRDVCETDDIHPKTKQPLALRIAAALEDI